MKALYHCLFLVLIPFCWSSVFGQDSKWKVGMHFSPDICYRWQPDVETSIAEFVLQNKLTSKFGYHGGIDLLYNMTSHFSLQATIRYSNMGVRTKTAGCEMPYDSLSMCSTHYNFDFLEVPIGLNYTIGAGKLMLVSGVYISSAFLTGNKRVTKITPASGDPYKDVEGTGPSNHYVSFFSGIRTGASYQCTDRLTLLLQPEFKFGIRRDFYSSHLWSLGLNVGLYYSL